MYFESMEHCGIIKFWESPKQLKIFKSTSKS